MSETQSSRPQMPSRGLPFHRLEAYQVALSLVGLAGRVPTTRGHADLRDQLRRAAASVVLNIAEGVGKAPGPDRRRYYLIARGSTCETAAAFDVFLALGVVGAVLHGEALHACDRVYAMLTRLASG